MFHYFHLVSATPSFVYHPAVTSSVAYTPPAAAPSLPAPSPVSPASPPVVPKPPAPVETTSQGGKT